MYVYLKFQLVSLLLYALHIEHFTKENNTPEKHSLIQSKQLHFILILSAPIWFLM